MPDAPVKHLLATYPVRTATINVTNARYKLKTKVNSIVLSEDAITTKETYRLQICPDPSSNSS
jgi:hypothetical protein